MSPAAYPFGRGVRRAGCVRRRRRSEPAPPSARRRGLSRLDELDGRRACSPPPTVPTGSSRRAQVSPRLGLRRPPARGRVSVRRRVVRIAQAVAAGDSARSGSARRPTRTQPRLHARKCGNSLDNGPPPDWTPCRKWVTMTVYLQWTRLGRWASFNGFGGFGETAECSGRDFSADHAHRPTDAFSLSCQQALTQTGCDNR